MSDFRKQPGSLFAQEAGEQRGDISVAEHAAHHAADGIAGRALLLCAAAEQFAKQPENARRQYTISDIRADQNVEAEFVEDITKVTDAGIAYTVTSYDEQTVVVAAGNYGNVLTVPASFTAKDKTWTVVGIGEEALKDNAALAAIVWNPEVLFTAKVSNPNLLLYVKSLQVRGIQAL